MEEEGACMDMCHQRSGPMQRMQRRGVDMLVWGTFASLVLLLLVFYESFLLDGARLVILSQLTLNNLDITGRQKLVRAMFSFIVVYFVLGAWTSLQPFLPMSVAMDWNVSLGNLSWRKLWDYKDELFVYLSATALLGESVTKAITYMVDDRKILECRVRGMSVMCINEAATESDASICDWMKEAGGAWKANVIAVQHQKVSQPMEWFPDLNTRLKVGDVVFLSCEGTVRLGSEDSDTHGMKLALYLAKGNEELVREVELACSPLVESMPEWLCGFEGARLGPPSLNLGGLDFRKISGGITLASIVHNGEPKWFPGPHELVRSGDGLLVVTALLRDGDVLFQQNLHDIKEHLQARLLDKDLFEALGGRLPFACPARPRGRAQRSVVRSYSAVLTYGPLRA
mmetsp:Transcript_67338/g.132830  ORF Transcript_67338/g.132830 Transcript_67338/m.132830 type:complete len:399 (-) Transcript_67338:54-1250(-)